MAGGYSNDTHRIAEDMALDDVIEEMEQRSRRQGKGAAKKSARDRKQPSRRSAIVPGGRGRSNKRGNQGISPRKKLVSAGGTQPLQQGPRYIGRVRRFDAKTGWGFLECDDLHSGDVFVHVNDCDSSVVQLREGDSLDFQVARSRDGALKAQMVRIASASGAKKRSKADNDVTGQQLQTQFVKRLRAASARGSQKKSKAGVRPPSSATLSASPRATDAPARSSAKAAIAKTATSPCVRVMNFPWTVTWQKLWSAFEAVGDILSVELDKKRVGQAIITFRSETAALQAIEEYDGGMLDERQIRVRLET
eukprot:TRINITY_DN11595_c0_g1_i1.p1 TRINITY_DN11595_c0_g1~~TRINITY_DN11595_c0_g1_i1.p1  ORF type:complete len:307 (-),score=54.35 TRINITY_DN11595_c0_g1_i1:148-1068(-)